MSVTQIEFRKKIFEVEYDYTPEEKEEMILKELHLINEPSYY